MGGVDRADQYRGCYTVRAKSRKCYRYVFWFLFEICVFNTYVLHHYSPSASKPLTEYKDFRVALANELIGSYCSRKSIGQPPKTTVPARALTVAHFPVKTTRGRCHYCQLIHQRQAHTVWYCQQCEHRLRHTGHSDFDCFLQYHVEKGLLWGPSTQYIHYCNSTTVSSCEYIPLWPTPIVNVLTTLSACVHARGTRTQCTYMVQLYTYTRGIGYRCNRCIHRHSCNRLISQYYPRTTHVYVSMCLAFSFSHYSHSFANLTQMHMHATHTYNHMNGKTYTKNWSAFHTPPCLEQSYW